MLPTRTYRASSSSPPPSGRYRPPSQACLTTPPTFGHAHGACSPQARARDSVRDSVRVRVSLGLGLAARRRVCAVTCARVCACACASYVCRPWVRWQRACSVCVRAADLQCACSSRHAKVRACTCTCTCTIMPHATWHMLVHTHQARPSGAPPNRLPTVEEMNFLRGVAARVCAVPDDSPKVMHLKRPPESARGSGREREREREGQGQPQS